MLKARWHGYEIDSSEAAYEAQVPQPEQLGTLVRGLLTTGYFVRSYYLTFEEPLIRLRDFIRDHGDLEDKLTAKTSEYLDKQIAKFDPTSWKASTIGVRAIESTLNYVGTHRQELLEAETFRFELTEEQKEMRDDHDYDDEDEFEPGGMVEEKYYYSEYEIPFDGVAFLLGCSLSPASKLEPREARRAYKLVHDNYEQVGLLDEMAGWGTPRDYVQESIDQRHSLSLRVRINPDATFTITGRWMDDGQFILPYYDYLLGLATKKAGVEIGIYCL